MHEMLFHIYDQIYKNGVNEKLVLLHQVNYRPRFYDSKRPENPALQVMRKKKGRRVQKGNKRAEERERESFYIVFF